MTRFAASVAGLLAVLVLTGCASTQGRFKNYTAAEARYEQARRVPGYEVYAAQFWKMNDAAQFDQKSGCYVLQGGPLTLLLVLDKTTKDGGTSLSKPLKIAIAETYTDVDSPKAKCFRKAYKGLATNIPPFLPFLLQATFK